MNVAGDLQLAMRISADVKQAQAALAQVQASIVGLEKTTAQSNVTAKGAADAMTAQAAAANTLGVAQAARGESEAQATARIKEMVQASLAAADANSTLNLSEQALLERSGQRAQASAAQIAAARQAAAVALADREAVTAQIADYTVLDSIMAKKAKTTEDVAAADAALDRLQAANALSSEELDAAFVSLNAVTDADTVALNANTAANARNAASKGLNSRTTYTISALLDDAATGQFSRSKRELAALANETGILRRIMTPTGLAIGGVVAAIVALSVAAIKGIEQESALDNALILTGNHAGVTAGQLDAMAHAAGATTGDFGDAYKAVTALTAAGKLQGNVLGEAARAAVEYSQLTGESIDKAISEMVKIGEDPVRAAKSLDSTLNFLSATEYEQIKAMADAGDQAGATARLMDLLTKAMDDDIAKANEQKGTLETLFDKWTRGLSTIKQDLLDIGKTAPVQAQLGAAIAKYNSDLALANKSNADNFLSRFGHNLYLDQAKKDYQQVLALQKQYQDALAKGNDQQDNDAAKQASDHLDELGKHYDQAGLKVKAFNTVVQDLWAEIRKGVPLPKDVAVDAQGNFSGKGFDYLVQQQENELGVTKPKKDRSLTGVDHAQLAADVAAVQNALKQIGDAYGNADKVLEAQHKAGAISDKAYYDGLRADLEKYESDEVAALEREKTAATSHIKTAEDRIRADQKVAQIDQQITQVHADAAAKREQLDADEAAAIKKSKDEWESLRRSMETPIDAKVDDAIAKIQKLNEALANGVGDSNQYNQLVTSVAQNSVTRAPHYEGVDAAVGGPSSELSRNALQMKALDDWHAQALAANQKFRQKDTANEVAYQAGLANIEKQYAAEKQNIEQSRQQLLLITTANLFGQLATLSSSHNKKVAAIGKAAAIAQAIINTYKNATIAYGDGLEAGGPYGVALGAVFAAVAVAAGLANVAAIRAQSVGGYAGGGAIDGPGSKTSDSILIKASRGEFMQQAAAVDYYGVDFMESVNNLRYPKFASGGSIGDAPRLTAPRLSQPRLSDASASRGAPQPISLKSILVLDKEVIPSAMSGADGSRVTMAHIKANIPTIRAWVNGKKS